MDFIAELIRTAGLYVGYVIVAGIGVALGIALRKKKNQKNLEK